MSDKLTLYKGRKESWERVGGLWILVLAEGDHVFQGMHHIRGVVHMRQKQQWMTLRRMMIMSRMGRPSLQAYLARKKVSLEQLLRGAKIATVPEARAMFDALGVADPPSEEQLIKCLGLQQPAVTDVVAIPTESTAAYGLVEMLTPEVADDVVIARKKAKKRSDSE
ncbi:MAG: hypothetical protein NUW00_04740 [Candidatus Kaiserbacteria bacterium]|nr:hypothetical protein [Candidatus Kaiserbacteria bacterium]